MSFNSNSTNVTGLSSQNLGANGAQPANKENNTKKMLGTSVEGHSQTGIQSNPTNATGATGTSNAARA